MAHHGAGSPKPTIVYSPMKPVGLLDRGKLPKAARESLPVNTVSHLSELRQSCSPTKTVLGSYNPGRHIDKSGKSRGNKAELKQSGFLADYYSFRLVETGKPSHNTNLVAPVICTQDIHSGFRQKLATSL